MSEVKKININNTDYDVADAKALRNKAEASNSFVDTRAGTTSYPTTGANITNSIFIGEGANSQSNGTKHNVVIGNSAKLTYTNNGYGYNTVVGNDAISYDYFGTAIGYNAQVKGFGTSMGCGANSNEYGTTLGGYASSYYGGVAIGYNAKIKDYASYSNAIGYNSSVGSFASYSTALGFNATVNSSNSIQLGSGTNQNYGTLKYRDWELVTNEGKIPVDRLSAEALGRGDTVVNLYQLPEDDSKHVVYQYTGTTNPLFTSNYFYRSEVEYSKPAISCSWVNSDFVKEQADVMIDQIKFFKQLMRETVLRKDNGDVNKGCVGGDNSSMGMYIYYDVDNDQWDLEFNDDNIEGHRYPDMIEDIDLDTWGIYLNTAGVTLPTESGAREEVFDLSYYAPLYFDSYDYNEGEFEIYYPQLMNALCDGDWGIEAVESIDNWDFDVEISDAETIHFYFPTLPKKYYDGDGMTFRFEWDTNHDGAWTQFINGEEKYVYAWSTSQLNSTFGINVYSGMERTVEYIEFTLKPARQLYWEYCNPVDTSQFVTNDPSSFPDNYDQTKVQILEHNENGEFTWKDDTFDTWDNNVVDLTGTTNILNLNNLRTSGWYKYQGNVTNGPLYINSTNSPILIRVINNGKTGYNEECSQRIYCGQFTTHTISGYSWGIVESGDYVRYYFGGWYDWQHFITNTSGSAIEGFDRTVQQKIIHTGGTSSSGSQDGRLKWVDDTGGSGGTTDYEELENKPQINSVELSGNVDLSDLGIAPESSLGGMILWKGTLAQYNAITTKDANTLYNITDDVDTGLDILQTIYPVGSLYLTTNAICPLASLFGTWSKVGTKIMTDVPSQVAVKGNGMTLGLTNGTNTFGINGRGGEAYIGGITGWTGNYGKTVGSTGSQGSERLGTNVMGITTDSSKSGMVADINSTSMAVNIFKRTA